MWTRLDVRCKWDVGRWPVFWVLTCLSVPGRPGGLMLRRWTCSCCSAWFVFVEDDTFKDGFHADPLEACVCLSSSRPLNPRGEGRRNPERDHGRLCRCPGGVLTAGTLTGRWPSPSVIDHMGGLTGCACPRGRALACIL